MITDSQDIEIQKGSTFEKVILWATSTKSYAAITAITQAAPAVVTAASHGVPDGWPCKIKSVSGMEEINSDNNHVAVLVDANTLRFPSINAVGYDAYESGGVVEFYTPVSMSGFTARMQIRSSISSDTELVELTTENGGIAIDDTAKTITITITAAATTAFTWSRGVYSLELIDGSGVVSQVAHGSVTALREVTR